VATTGAAGRPDGGFKPVRVLPRDMSVSGLCEICERREVVDGCDRCGRLVCEEHFERRHGVCAECFAEVGGGPTGGRESGPGRGGRDRPDGVGEYRF